MYVWRQIIVSDANPAVTKTMECKTVAISDGIRQTPIFHRANPTSCLTEPSAFHKIASRIMKSQRLHPAFRFLSIFFHTPLAKPSKHPTSPAPSNANHHQKQATGRHPTLPKSLTADLGATSYNREGEKIDVSKQCRIFVPSASTTVHHN